MAALWSPSNVDMTWNDIAFSLVCPFLGCLLAAAMFAAPIADLRRALMSPLTSNNLNPLPWAVMTGNCLGWCIYSYYTHDPFVLAANLPGLILSLWLNLGAAKLQYQALLVHHQAQGPSLRHRPVLEEATSDHDYVAHGQQLDGLVFTTQEIWLFRILLLWSLVLVGVGWLSPLAGQEAQVVGVIVNINLVWFYGAPLQTLSQVIQQRTSKSIHRPTMVMAGCNSTFWFLYGVALSDPVIMLPNGTGIVLFACQVFLCCLFPATPSQPAVVASTMEMSQYRDAAPDPYEKEENPEVSIPSPGIS